LKGLSKNQIKFVKSLQQKKFRQVHRKFTVEGKKMVEEAMSSTFGIDEIYCTAEFQEDFPHAIAASAKEIQQMSGFKTSPGVLAVMSEPNECLMKSAPLSLVLDGIKDPGNMGSLVRSASWFGIDQVIVTDDSVDVFNPKSVQATMGAIFHIPICRAAREVIVGFLKNEGTHIHAADMEGEDSAGIAWEFPLALIIGSESHGVSDAFRKVSIPTHIRKKGKGESLNAATAGAILLSKITEHYTPNNTK